MGEPGYYFYSGDYARDTLDLSDLEDLAYRRLLDHYYAKGAGITPEIPRLCRIVRASSPEFETAVAHVLMTFFPIGPDGLRHNKRADRILEEKKAFSMVQSMRAQKRWSHSPADANGIANGNANGMNPAMPMGYANGNAIPLPSPLPLPSPNPSPLPTPVEARTKATSLVKPSDAAVRISACLLKSLEGRIHGFRRPNVAAWEREADRMLRLDQRTESDAIELITWVESDPFWQANIMSMKTLREKWDQLQAKRRVNGGERTGAAGLPLDQLGHAGQETLAAAVRAETRLRDKGVIP